MPYYTRAENMLLGTFDSDYEENGSDPDEPHPDMICESYVRDQP